MTLTKMPRFVRQFAFDAIKGAVMGVVLLNLPLAGSVNEAQGQAVLVVTVAIRAIFGAAGFAVPAFLAYVASKLNVDEDYTPDYAPAAAPDDFAVFDKIPPYEQL